MQALREDDGKIQGAVNPNNPSKLPRRLNPGPVVGVSESLWKGGLYDVPFWDSLLPRPDETLRVVSKFKRRTGRNIALRSEDR